MIFKVLVNGRSCHGGYSAWTPGEWMPAVEPRICEAGYHLTSDPLRWWMPNAELWLAEWRGAINGTGDEKAAFAQARITERVTRDWPLLVMFPRLRAFLAASERSVDRAADIAWAELSWANLSEANLSEANLSEANLSEANLSRANLSRANLSRANLSRANLSWAYRPTDPPSGWRSDTDGRLSKLVEGE